jgi:urease accessory protein
MSSLPGLSTLLALADSRLPTGGHVHSGGVEEAVTSGLVVDLSTLRAFLRRRIRTHGLVTASVAAAVHARTPAPASRSASRAQGRGLVRLARKVWPEWDWTSVGAKPHLGVAAGAVGSASGLLPEQTAISVVYTTMTGSATAAQRLLALDPGDVAALVFALSPLCDQTAAEAVKELADLSDPLLDALAQRHVERDRPLFVS